MYYIIVEIWHTILLDFTCSLDIMEKVISKKFFFLYFVSNLLIFSISHSGNIFYVQLIKLLITKFKYSSFAMQI